MPASKNSNYPVWTLKFEEYWVKDDEERHMVLLSFCKDALIMERSSQSALLDLDTLHEICKDPIILQPSDFGSVSKQRSKKFHHFRRCVLAELLLLAFGIDKDIIHYIPTTDEREKKKARPLSLVKRYMDSEKEGARIRALKNYFKNEQHWSIVSSPVSKYETERKKEKEGVSKENANTNISKDNIRITNKLEVITQAPAVIVTPKKSLLVTMDSSVSTSFDESILLTEDKQQLKSHKKSTRHNEEEMNTSNYFIMKSDHEMEIDEISDNRRSRLSNLPRVVSPSSTTTTADKKSNDTVRVSNLDGDTQCEPRPLRHIPRTINKYGLEWHLHDHKNYNTKVKKETLSRDAKKLLVCLNEISLNDVERASQILKIAGERLKSISKVQNEHQIPKELILAGQVVNNIRQFLNREQFLLGYGGRRDDTTQHVLSGIWCAMSSPSFHYVSTEYGIGRAIEYNEVTNMHKIDLGWGCLYSPALSVYGASTTIQPLKLKHVDGPSSHDLKQLMGMTSIRAAKKGEELRDMIELGKNVFKEIKHQKHREDNVREELEYAVNKFCHDPQFVRPDNYCKQLYNCRNLDGSSCKHQRHNWYHAGSISMQHELFLESEHYAFFSKTLCEKFPLRFKNAEDTFLKASLQAFKRCVRKQANCVKEETRASCVDPIEAKSYDLARSLQMYFNMQYNNTKRFLKEEDNHYDDNYQMNFLDGNANNDDCDSIVDDDDDEEEEDEDEEKSIVTMTKSNGRSSTNISRSSSSSSSAPEENNEQGCSASCNGQTFSDDCDYLSLSEKFNRCKCEDCLSGKQNWFERLGPSRHGRPHRMLLDSMLCPRVMHHDLSLEHEKPIKLHNWKCGKLQCNECGIDRLPWNCPVIKNLDQKISVWIWEKDDAGHSKESTKKVRLPVNQIFLALKEALTDLSKHIIQLEFLNRQRYLNLMKMPLNKAVICTDFSAQMDLVPVRKLSCHVNKHASLGVFCIYMKRQLNVHGKGTITFIDCHDWYVFGSCDEKGKKNDWIFHTAALKYIVAYYREHNPSILSIDLWTDNCPGQYKCRQNLYQVAKFTKQNNHLQRITHHFAMQYGFKGKHDTAGNYIKSQIRKLEMQDDTHAFDAEAAYQLAKKFVEKNKSVWEQKIKDCNPELQYKSPHETSQRFIAYMEDDEWRLMALKKRYPDGHIIHSNRKYMQELEDIEPIKDIKSYYKFWHCLDDDELSEEHFQDYDDTNAALTYACKFCQKTYKSRSTSFIAHVQTCQLSVELGLTSILRYQRLPCYCSMCTCGRTSECKYVEATGSANYTLLTSVIEQQRLQELSREKISRDEYVKMIAIAIEAVNILIHGMNVDILFPGENFTFALIENLLPSMLEKNRNIKMLHYEAMAGVLQVDIRRSDGQIGKPCMNDYMMSLEQHGGWKFVILSLLHVLKQEH